MIDSLKEDVARIELAKKKLQVIRECIISTDDCFSVVMNYNSGTFVVDIMINRLHLD